MPILEPLASKGPLVEDNYAHFFVACRDCDQGEVAVVVSEMEHHSNLLPWRDIAAAEVVVAESDEAGRVDIAKLNELLAKLRLSSR